MSVGEAWDRLIDYNLASEETLQVVTSINGYSIDTLEDVLYATTGYRTFEQYLDEDEDEWFARISRKD